jgi:hypothetical protein
MARRQPAAPPHQPSRAIPKTRLHTSDDAEAAIQERPRTSPRPSTTLERSGLCWFSAANITVNWDQQGTSRRDLPRRNCSGRPRRKAQSPTVRPTGGRRDDIAGVLQTGFRTPAGCAPGRSGTGPSGAIRRKLFSRVKHVSRCACGRPVLQRVPRRVPQRVRVSAGLWARRGCRRGRRRRCGPCTASTSGTCAAPPRGPPGERGGGRRGRGGGRERERERHREESYAGMSEESPSNTPPTATRQAAPRRSARRRPTQPARRRRGDQQGAA